MNFWEHRIIHPSKLSQLVQNSLQGKKLVFTNGCFDILHYGHLCYLSEAKKLGELLLVALNSDNSLQKIKRQKPVMSLKHRLAIIAALGFVDLVTWFETDTPEELLAATKPNILVKGGDYKLDEVVGAKLVQSYGGEVFVLGHQKGLSSSLFAKKLKK